MKVSESHELAAVRNKSFVKKVCGYYKQHSSVSTKWGKDNEGVARNAYIQEFRSQHKNFVVSECGLFISTSHPFLGASPDGVVHCDCHGKGLLEIKCPWTHRGLNISEFADEKGTCLVKKNGNVHLIQEHQYYFQIQCQLGVTELPWCDSYLCTSKGSFCERITFDSEKWEQHVNRCFIAFRRIILPELLYENVRHEIVMEK